MTMAKITGKSATAYHTIAFSNLACFSMMPRKFGADISKGSELIVLTDEHPDNQNQPQTDKTSTIPCASICCTSGTIHYLR